MRRNSSLALMIWPSFREKVMPTMLESPSCWRGEWILGIRLAGIILPLVRLARLDAEGGTISVAMSLEHSTNGLIGVSCDSLITKPLAQYRGCLAPKEDDDEQFRTASSKTHDRAP